MLNFLSSLISFVVAHSLLLSALGFILLRQRLSHRLSVFLVEKYFPAAPAAPLPVRLYDGWFDRLTRAIPDYIDDTVMRRAREQRVAEQVRRRFLELVIVSLFKSFTTLVVFLTGYALARLHVISVASLGFVVRALSLGIAMQNLYYYFTRWDFPLKKVKEIYGEFGFNLVRFIEVQIFARVYREACARIDRSVQGLGRWQRWAYRFMGSGTECYARAISQQALDENRRFIRLIAVLAPLSLCCYYAVMRLFLAPLVARLTGERFFRFVYVDPAAGLLQFCAAHPLFAVSALLAGWGLFHERNRLARLCAPLWRRLAAKLKPFLSD